MGLEFPNRILVLNEEVTFVEIDNSIRVILNEELINPRTVRQFKIECVECKTLLERKVLTKKLMVKPYVCMSCQTTGEKNSFYGKKHSEEFKARLSKERKGKWGLGETNPMFGVNVWEYVSEAKREEMREKNRIASTNWKDNPFRDIKGYLGEERWAEARARQRQTVLNWTEAEKQEFSNKISMAARRHRERDPDGYRALKQKAARASCKSQASYKKNKLEFKVEEWLIRQNLPYTYSPIMSSETETYQFDFIVHDRRVLIECHGTYWHAHPDFYPNRENLTHAQVQNLTRDAMKSKYAAEKNFELLVIWEHDVKVNDFSALDSLLT